MFIIILIIGLLKMGGMLSLILISLIRLQSMNITKMRVLKRI